MPDLGNMGFWVQFHGKLLFGVREWGPLQNAMPRHLIFRKGATGVESHCRPANSHPYSAPPTLVEDPFAALNSTHDGTNSARSLASWRQ